MYAEPYLGCNAPGANSLEGAPRSSNVPQASHIRVIVHGNYWYKSKLDTSVEKKVIFYAFCFLLLEM